MFIDYIHLIEKQTLDYWQHIFEMYLSYSFFRPISNQYVNG